MRLDRSTVSVAVVWLLGLIFAAQGAAWIAASFTGASETVAWTNAFVDPYLSDVEHGVTVMERLQRMAADVDQATRYAWFGIALFGIGCAWLGALGGRASARSATSRVQA
ncbi:MAG: hypothetical protein AAF192_22005 [Pseudomonadota bacterium]